MTPDQVRGRLSSDAGATSSSISSPTAPSPMPMLSPTPSLTLSPVSTTSDNSNHRPFAGGLLRSSTSPRSWKNGCAATCAPAVGHGTLTRLTSGSAGNGATCTGPSTAPADDRFPAQRYAGQEDSEALLQACPRPEAHPQPARGRDRPPQELSRRAARDEAEARAVALRPAPAWALAQQPGRARPPPHQAPDPAHARLSELLDGEADAGRHRGDGDAGQGTGACRAQG